MHKFSKRLALLEQAIPEPVIKWIFTRSHEESPETLPRNTKEIKIIRVTGVRPNAQI